LVERRILLNPGPATTSDAVKQALVIPDVCPREREYTSRMADVRRRLAALVGDPEATVAIPIVGSGTTALEAALTTFVPQDGRAVIVENGVYGKRLMEIARIHAIPFVALELGWGTPTDLAALEQLIEAQDGRATHLVFVHHETSSGLLTPAEPVCELAGRHGLDVICDAMSSYGAIPMRCADDACDVIVSSSNKCIQGMAGYGLVMCTRAAIERARATGPRTLVLDLVAELDHIEKTGQTRFTTPPQVLSALARAIEETEAETVEGRRARYDRSMATLVAGLRAQGFELLLPDEHQSRILVAILEPDEPWWSFDALHDRLLERGFTIYPGTAGRERTWRLSVLGDIDHSDVEHFLAALADCTAAMKAA